MEELKTNHHQYLFYFKKNPISDPIPPPRKKIPVPPPRKRYLRSPSRDLSPNPPPRKRSGSPYWPIWKVKVSFDFLKPKGYWLPASMLAQYWQTAFYISLYFPQMWITNGSKMFMINHLEMIVGIYLSDVSGSFVVAWLLYLVGPMVGQSAWFQFGNSPKLYQWPNGYIYCKCKSVLILCPFPTGRTDVKVRVRMVLIYLGSKWISKRKH